MNISSVNRLFYEQGKNLHHYIIKTTKDTCLIVLSFADKVNYESTRAKLYSVVAEDAVIKQSEQPELFQSLLRAVYAVRAS